MSVLIISLKRGRIINILESFRLSFLEIYVQRISNLTLVSLDLLTLINSRAQFLNDIAEIIMVQN